MHKKLEVLNEAILTQRTDVEREELVVAYKKFIKDAPQRADGGQFIEGTSQTLFYSLLFVVFLFIATPVIAYCIEQILQIRCIVPNNYIIWEATR